MDTYIATFYSHFGAVRFGRELKKKGISGTAMPVPRNLSSSCGTCVKYEADDCMAAEITDETEKIVRVCPDGYEDIYQSENS